MGPRRCHVVVGTVGRVCALLEAGTLQPNGIQTLVLDEADSLVSDSFQEDIK